MKIGVYIPTCNRLRLLQRAVESVRNQTFRDFEIVVCDDGSQDGTYDYLRSMQSKGVLRFCRNETPEGGASARNKAILLSQAEFITGLDDDDYFESGRLEAFVQAWDSQKIGDQKPALFDSVEVLISEKFTVQRFTTSFVTAEMLRCQNLIGNQVYAPREWYVASGLFDMTMPAWQDWDLWLRLSQLSSGFKNIGKKSYIADESHESERISTKHEALIRSAMIKMIKKYGPYSCAEKGSLVQSLLSYPQVHPKISDILTLIASHRWRTVWRALHR